MCDPCSKKRVPIPAIGITVPVRVCDRCYNGWGTLYETQLDFDDNEAAKGEVDGDASSAETQSSRKEKPVGKKEGSVNSRRSAVVDELASRIPSITM